MVNGISAVHGHLLKRARLQQDFTMRWVQQHGGPSPAYQSEVENGKKSEVGSPMLHKWTKILHVTPAFARGELPRFASEPAKCRGLAGEIAPMVRKDALAEGWTGISPFERARRVLCLIEDHCSRLPRVVLAHVMGVQLKALDDMICGQADIDQNHLKTLVELTTLPDQFFRTGALEAADDVPLIDRYLPAIQLANERRVSPEQLIAFILRQGTDGSPGDEGIDRPER